MARVSTLFFTKVGAEKYEKFTNKTLNPLSSSNYESSDAKFAPVLGRAMMNTLYNMYVQFCTFQNTFAKLINYFPHNVSCDIFLLGYFSHVLYFWEHFPQ